MNAGRHGDDQAHAQLRVTVDFPLPARVEPGVPTAVFCFGSCFHPRAEITSLELVAGPLRTPVGDFAMPRPDVLATARAEFGDSAAAFRSGFWQTVDLVSPPEGTIEMRLEAVLADGTVATGTFATLTVAPGPEPVAAPAPDGPGDLIAICMATFDPDLELFRRQVESLRAQTHERWICVISDDHSDSGRFEAIRATVAEDPRFIVSRSDRRLGFYRNFERALELAPPDATLIALCDQDDVWYPDKLAVLAARLGDAELVYSDQRLVDREGRVIAESLWSGRRNNYSDLTSLLIANSVTGAAAMFRRGVAEASLPFPQMPGWQFHDHWLSLVALARGRIAYVDRPLYDYVQHGGAIIGQVSGADVEARGSLAVRARTALRSAITGWRPIYFCGYQRLAVQARILLARCGAELSPGNERRYSASPLPMIRRRACCASDCAPPAHSWGETRPSAPRGSWCGACCGTGSLERGCVGVEGSRPSVWIRASRPAGRTALGRRGCGAGGAAEGRRPCALYTRAARTDAWKRSRSKTTPAGGAPRL